MGNLIMTVILVSGMVLKNKLTPPLTKNSPPSRLGFPAVFSLSNPAVNSITGNSGHSITQNFQTFIKNLSPNFGASAPAISNLSPLRTFDPAFAYNPNRTIQPIIRAH